VEGASSQKRGKRTQVYVYKYVAVIERAGETEIVRYNRVWITWKERREVGRGIGYIVIDYSNSKYTALADDAEIVLVDI